MNMIVCTCDTCGRIVENWNTLNINIRGDMWKREVCNDCYKGIKNKIDTFIDSITVTKPEEKSND